MMNGSSCARSMPANARRTGKPSPSKPCGAVVTCHTGRGWSPSPGVFRRGRTVMSSTVIAGMSSPRALDSPGPTIVEISIFRLPLPTPPGCVATRSAPGRRLGWLDASRARTVRRGRGRRRPQRPGVGGLSRSRRSLRARPGAARRGRRRRRLPAGLRGATGAPVEVCVPGRADARPDRRGPRARPPSSSHGRRRRTPPTSATASTAAYSSSAPRARRPAPRSQPSPVVRRSTPHGRPSRRTPPRSRPPSHRP